MQRVKIFRGSDSELATLEAEINTFLEKAGARVVQITGNIAPQTSTGGPRGSFASSDVLVVILYEK